MQQDLTIAPLEANAGEGKTVAVYFSHVLAKNNQLEPANVANFLAVFKSAGFAKVVLIPTGMLNTHVFKGAGDDRNKAAFNLTLDFLRSIVDVITSSEIDVSILPFCAVKYSNISSPDIVKGDSVQTLQKLEAWGADVIAKIGNKQLLEAPIFVDCRNDIEKAYHTNEQRFKEEVDTLAEWFTQRKQGEVKTAKVENARYLMEECILTSALSSKNKNSLSRTGKKEFHYSLYAGGLYNRPMMLGELYLILEPYRLDQLVLDTESKCLKRVPLSLKFTASKSNEKKEGARDGKRRASDEQGKKNAPPPDDGSHPNTPRKQPGQIKSASAPGNPSVSMKTVRSKSADTPPPPPRRQNSQPGSLFSPLVKPDALERRKDSFGDKPRDYYNNLSTTEAAAPALGKDSVKHDNEDANMQGKGRELAVFQKPSQKNDSETYAACLKGSTSPTLFRKKQRAVAQGAAEAVLISDLNPEESRRVARDLISGILNARK